MRQIICSEDGRTLYGLSKEDKSAIFIQTVSMNPEVKTISVGREAIVKSICHATKTDLLIVA